MTNVHLWWGFQPSLWHFWPFLRDCGRVWNPERPRLGAGIFWRRRSRRKRRWRSLWQQIRRSLGQVWHWLGTKGRVGAAKRIRMAGYWDRIVRFLHTVRELGLDHIIWQDSHRSMMEVVDSYALIDISKYLESFRTIGVFWLQNVP